MHWTIEETSTLDAIWKRLGKKFTVVQSAPRAVKFDVLDDFNHHLLRSQSTLVRQEDSYQLTTPALVYLHESAHPFKFAYELPVGPFRAALAERVDLRKLQPVASSLLSQHLVTLHTKEDKAVIQVSRLLDRPWAYLHLQPFPGYEAFSKPLHKQLTAQGARRIDKPLAQLLLEDVGFQLSHYTAKPSFDLSPGMPAREALRLMSRTLLGIARHNEPGIIHDGDDTEFLHDYRVSLRKVRSLHSLLKDVYPPPVQKQLQRRLGSLARRTNTLRDLDVYLLEQDSYAQLLPDSLREGLVTLFDDFRQRHEEAQSSVQTWLTGDAYRQEMDSLLRFFAEPDAVEKSPQADKAIKPLVSRKINRRYRRICRLGLQITPRTPDAEVHALRIECKKFRYLLELFGGLYKTAKLKQLVKKLKQLQDNLGRFNDFSVQQEALRHYLDSRPPNNQLALSIGALLLALSQKQQAQRSQVETRFTAFADEETAAWVHDLFD